MEANLKLPKKGQRLTEVPDSIYKIQPQSFFFIYVKCFHHIWALRPSWSTDQDHLDRLSNPWTEDFTWSLVKTGLAISEYMLYKCVNEQQAPDGLWTQQLMWAKKLKKYEILKNAFYSLQAIQRGMNKNTFHTSGHNTDWSDSFLVTQVLLQVLSYVGPQYNV